MPTAMYGPMFKKVTSMGVMTAAALIPAKPVPRPPHPGEESYKDRDKEFHVRHLKSTPDVAH